MRLALKQVLGVSLITLAVVGADAWLQNRRRPELMTADVAEKHPLARVLQDAVAGVWASSGEGAARDFVIRTNEATPRIGIRWLPPDLLPDVPGRNLAQEVAAAAAPGACVVWVGPRTQGETQRYTYVPIRKDGELKAVVELTESMGAHDAFLRRSQLYSGVTGLAIAGLSALVALLLGSRFVDRPVQLLRDHLRALGDGKPARPLMLRQRDELGGLAEELNQATARVAARERMRHADRLRTVGQLASGVAHELGTPLGVITLRAGMIARGEVGGQDVAPNAQVILDQAGRMTTIVRQLLDYSRRQGAVTALVDLRHVVTRTLDLVEPLAHKCGVTTQVEAPAQPMFIRASESQLQQVLTNVILNGVQAMATGGTVRIELGRRHVAPPDGHGGEAGEYCVVCVIDQGPGIAPEDLAHVFEPFFTTKPVGEGTGLGLAVAQAIIEEHGGWITAASEPGRGARFTIYLVAAADEVRQVAS